MPKSFYTDNMTIQEILNLSEDVIRGMTQRDLSRAVRTLSLAANKRVNRLNNYFYKRKDKQTGDIKFIEKKNSPGLDPNALYGLRGKFGVGDKNINQLRQEFVRVRNFLNAPSTTISGAKALRQQKEVALFGKTREQMLKAENMKRKKEGKRPLTKKDTWGYIKPLNELMSDVYEEFHKWKETYALQGGYDTDKGNEALELIGRKMILGMSGEEAREEVSRIFEGNYVEQEKQRLLNAARTDLPDSGNY